MCVCVYRLLMQCVFIMYISMFFFVLQVSKLWLHITPSQRVPVVQTFTRMLHCQQAVKIVHKKLMLKLDVCSYALFTARCYASAVLAMGLCLSVHLPLTSRSSTKTAKRRITQTTPHDTPGSLIFWFSDAKDLREIRPGSPPTRAPNAGGVGQNRRLSTCNWLYLDNGKR